MFTDREDAGHRLADLFDKRDETADLMLVIPRGDLPVGREVTDRLKMPFDVVVASKAGTPDDPELAVGAIVGDESAWWNEDLLSYFDMGGDYLDREYKREAAATRDKVSLYRGGDPLPDVVEKRVAVVDDGATAGVTTRAHLRQVVTGDAGRVTLAAPVGPPNILSELEAEYDAVAAVESPEAPGIVGVFYCDSAQVSDEEAATYFRGGAGEHRGELLTAKTHRRVVMPNLSGRVDQSRQ